MKTTKAIVAIAVLAVLSVSVARAQTSNANIWYFGINVGLDFATSPPTVLKGGNCCGVAAGAGYNVESSTSVTDDDGNLLFVTSGPRIYNGNLVQNATTLSTTTDAAQGNLVFPRPGTTNQYYICTVDAAISGGGCGGIADFGSDRGARYRTITATGGGNITVGAEGTAVGSGTAECQVGVPNSAGTGYWWIFHERGNSNFRVFSVLNGGITAAGAGIGTQAVAPAFGACTFTSVLKVNSCYNKLALTFGNTVTLFNFNNTTGAISNPQTWTVNGAYGVEFSPNGTYLYVSQGTQGGDPMGVLQFNISSGVAATINGTVNSLGTGYGGLGKTGHLQLAPDGKIYLAQMSANAPGTYPHWIGAINNPNNTPGATFTQQYIRVDDTGPTSMAVTMGLPTFLKSFLSEAPPNININLPQYYDTLLVCTGENFVSTFTTSAGVSSVIWDFDDGTTSSATSPTHSYSAAGFYNVTLQVTDVCGRVYDGSRKVLVPAYNTTATATCSGTNVVLTGTGTRPGNYHWFDNTGKYLGSGSPLLVDYSASPGTAPTSFRAVDYTYSGDLGTLGPAPAALTTCDGTANTTSNFTLTADGAYMPSLSLKRDGLAGCGATTVTITLRQGATVIGTYNHVWGATCNTQVIPVNFTLPAAGTYSLTLSATNGAMFCAIKYTTFNPITVDGLGTNTGAAATNSGPFADMVFQTLPPCAPQATANRVCALPIELLDFYATPEQYAVVLNWSSGSEMNSEKFEIERSSDGINFTKIGIVNASGESHTVRMYSYTDAANISGTVYYRLRMVDLDGQFSYSKIISVQTYGSAQAYVSPNPFQTSTTLSLNTEVVADVRVMNAVGVVVEEYSSVTTESIELGATLPRGVYVVSITTETDTYTVRIVKE